MTLPKIKHILKEKYRERLGPPTAERCSLFQFAPCHLLVQYWETSPFQPRLEYKFEPLQGLRRRSLGFFENVGVRLSPK